MFPFYVKTRWLSRTDCLDVLRTNLPVLLAFLGQYNAKSHKDSQYWPSTAHLRKRLMGLKALSTLFLVLNMLYPLNFVQKIPI